MDNSNNQYHEKTLQVCSGAAIVAVAIMSWLRGDSLREIGLNTLYWIFIYAITLLVIGRFVK